tara:strand:+ start:1080 stop:1385 length:306 start_codon:yes stop_codon:yes gene_type:complete
MTAFFGNVMLEGRSSAGHCFTPVKSTSTANGVEINGKRPVLDGDPYVGPHNCGDKSHPPGSAVATQRKVLVNGRAVHKTGDPISCGDKALGPPCLGVIIGS